MLPETPTLLVTCQVCGAAATPSPCGACDPPGRDEPEGGSSLPMNLWRCRWCGLPAGDPNCWHQSPSRA